MTIFLMQYSTAMAMLIGGGILGLFVLFPMRTWLICWLTRPIVDLHENAKRLIHDEKQPLIPIGPNDDALTQLGQQLNQLATRSHDRIHALETERAKITAILDGMVEGVIALNAQGHILFMNPSARQIFELDAAQGEGQSLLEVIRHRGLADLVDQAQSRGKDGAYHGEIELEPLSHRILDITSLPVPFGSSTKGILLVLHDITTLRRLERMRVEFVANVSHELRTPLTAIKGYLETVLDETAAHPSPHRKFLEVANTHTERLGRLVDDLLQLSNIETGKVSLRVSPVPLNEFMNDISAMFTKDAVQKKVTFINHIPVSLQVQADRDRLTQIFVNLVDNALKHTPESGTISFTAHLEPDGIAIIQVQDTGQGIPSTALPRLTERFYRVDTARSREQGGTGLGLAIVKHLVQLHGGHLHIDSEPNKGTTVHVALPVV